MENGTNKKPPCLVLACGAVRGAVWADDRVIDNEVVEVHSIKFDRSYKGKDDGEWQHTEVFNTEDLLKLAMLATELYKRLRVRSYGDRRQSNDNLQNTESESSESTMVMRRPSSGSADQI